MKKIKTLVSITILLTLGLSACSMLLPSDGFNNNGNSNNNNGSNGNNNNGNNNNNNNSSPRADGKLTKEELIIDANKIVDFEKEHLSYFDIGMKQEYKDSTGRVASNYIQNGHLRFYNDNILYTYSKSTSTDSNGETRTYSSYSWLMMNSTYTKVARIDSQDGHAEQTDSYDISSYDDVVAGLLPGGMIKSALTLEERYQGEGDFKVLFSDITVSSGIYTIKGSEVYDEITRMDFEMSFKLNSDYSLQYLNLFGSQLSTFGEGVMEISYKYTNIKYNSRIDAPSDIVTSLSNLLIYDSETKPISENISEETLKGIIVKAVKQEKDRLYYAISRMRTYFVTSSGDIINDEISDMKIYAYQDSIYEVNQFLNGNHVSQMFYKSNNSYSQYAYFDNFSSDKNVTIGYSSSYASFATEMSLPASFLMEILLFDDTRSHSESDIVEFIYIKRSENTISFEANYQNTTMEVVFIINNDGSISNLSFELVGGDASIQVHFEYSVLVVDYGTRTTAPEDALTIFDTISL